MRTAILNIVFSLVIKKMQWFEMILLIGTHDELLTHYKLQAMISNWF